VPEIEVNGVPLAYVDEGQGSPLILVHGSISDARTWAAQVPFFAQHFRVIAYSRRFHHPHSWTGSGPDYSAALHAEDLAALAAALGIERAHLVGASYGALTSLLCAVRRPHLARSLVLAEPPLLLWLEGQPEGKAALDAFLLNGWQPATRAFQSGNREQGVRSFVNGVSGAPVFDQLPEPVRRLQLDNAPALQAEMEAPAADYFSSLTCEDAAGMSVPVLLLRGERSPQMFGLILDQLARCLPDCRRATIPNASHSMAAGNPPAFNATVLDFLRSTGG
jgi:pimeloyl-ACP methyl ester carboxylesterase